jgi:hypothetical protein
MHRWQAIAPTVLGALALGGIVAWAGLPATAPASTSRGVSGKAVIRTETETIAPGGLESRTFTAFCLRGEHASGGGWRVVGPVPVPVTTNGDVPQSSSPEPSDGETPIGWKVIGTENDDTVAHDVTVFAVCEKP